jgi:hypothetical protein
VRVWEGSPPERPAGIEQAGCPVTSNGAVLDTISRARPMMTSTGASGGGIRLAVIGSVGITRTSQVSSAVS